jgi:hypothetical protein
MDNFIWETEEDLATNELTMHDYIDNHMPHDWVVLDHDGTYAEIITPELNKYELHASGNGDFKNHKIEFIKH